MSCGDFAKLALAAVFIWVSLGLDLWPALPALVQNQNQYFRAQSYALAVLHRTAALKELLLYPMWPEQPKVIRDHGCSLTLYPMQSSGGPAGSIHISTCHLAVLESAAGDRGSNLVATTTQYLPFPCPEMHHHLQSQTPLYAPLQHPSSTTAKWQLTLTSLSAVCISHWWKVPYGTFVTDITRQRSGCWCQPGIGSSCKWPE